MFAMTSKLSRPSVLRATGTTFSRLYMYDRKRLPYWSNARLGSQHVSPRRSGPPPMASPVPLIFRVHVCPPSKVMPSKRPEKPSPTFVTTTMLFGFVGLTALASSASSPTRWVTSTSGGIAPPPTGVTASPSATSNSTTPACGRFSITPRPSSGRCERTPLLPCDANRAPARTDELAAISCRAVDLHPRHPRRPRSLAVGVRRPPLGDRSHRSVVPRVVVPQDHGQPPTRLSVDEPVGADARGVESGDHLVPHV